MSRSTAGVRRSTLTSLARPPLNGSPWRSGAATRLWRRNLHGDRGRRTAGGCRGPGDAAELDSRGASNRDRPGREFRDQTVHLHRPDARDRLREHQHGLRRHLSCRPSRPTPTRLTETSFPEADPVWSPDSERIAFASNRDGTWRIYLMDADGTM